MTNAFAITAEDRALFAATLTGAHARYDPACRMLAEHRQEPRKGQVHTLAKGVVHENRSSLNYAVDLLETGIEEFRLRAMDILDQVISLQDANPESRTYGVWPYLLEEPFDKMPHPDFNWADFCGVQLLQVAFNHGDRLPEALKVKIREAILHAAAGIRRRDVRPGYTNIAVMGSYVTLAAAELYQQKDLFIYAKQRLHKLCEYTIGQGGLTEYNSPCYTIVALFDLSRMRGHVQDPDCMTMVDFLLDCVWHDIAVHYHPPTRQLAGPHSRSYSTLTEARTDSHGSFLRIIQVATGGKVRLMPDDRGAEISIRRAGIACPEKYHHYFTTLEKPREESLTYYKGTTFIYFKQVKGQPFEVMSDHPRQAACYMTPQFALGTFFRNELWNQARNLVAYWGTHAKPCYLHLRCLKDGWDYASAYLQAVQSEGDVAGIVNFRTDGCDTSVNTDAVKNATIRTRDFRLRFEFGGASETVVLPPSWNAGRSVEVKSGDLVFRIAVPHCRFGDTELRYETGRDEKIAWCDIVFHSGEEKAICFRDLPEAVCAFLFSIRPANQTAVDFANAAIAKKGNALKLTWHTGKKKLTTTARCVPGTWKELNALSFA